MSLLFSIFYMKMLMAKTQTPTNGCPPTACYFVCFVRKEKPNATANKRVSFSAGLCLNHIYIFLPSPTAATQIISPCLACVSLIRWKHGEPYMDPFNTLEPQTEHVFRQDFGLDGDGCTAVPVCS